jgi:integrase
VYMARKLGQIIAVRENTWMIRIPLGCDPETKERTYYNRTVHGSLRQAQKFLGKKINQLGADRERDGAKIRLDQFLDQWLKTIKTRVCSKTYESYERLLAKYIRPSLGKRCLVAIRPFDVQTVYQQMTDRGLSPRTVQGAHWVLNAALRQALQWEMILEVPSKGLNLPRIRRREMQVFSVEQTKLFLKFALPTMYGTVSFVQIDSRQRTVPPVNWHDEHDRPVFFFELRDRYVCSWCELHGGQLILVPTPQSRGQARHIRYPDDATIVGRVTAVAMRIAEARESSAKRASLI